mgnify:CR=1 FL=1
MTKTVAVLGSTGSIGRQTLQVVQELGLTVAALTANRQVDLLEQQARQFHPKLAVLYDRAAAGELRLRLSDTDIRVAAGPEGLLEAATLPEADTVVTAVMGSVGLEPTLAAIREKKRIALANKETLVCAGELVMAEAERCGAEIVPVDSEHSAIFQCLSGERSEVEKVILTASGGPFLNRSADELRHVTVAEALAHPSWCMGAKVTIDSASLMNKGFEVIEARWLFGVDAGRIDVVIHPGSVVHSMVQFRDGAVKAQIGTPDMHLPIQYALTYPQRLPLEGRRLDFCELGTLEFRRPDTDRFPNLALAYECLRRGGCAGAVLNAANEVGVAAFLDGKIRFTDIARINEQTLSRMPQGRCSTLEQYRETDAAARETALSLI